MKYAQTVRGVGYERPSLLKMLFENAQKPRGAVVATLIKPKTERRT